MSDRDQGSFLNGFTLGIFAGAVGYFLFGTNKGKSFRNDISKEWESAKGKLAEDGIIDSKEATLREVINDFVTKVLGSKRAEELVPTAKTQKEKSQKSPLDSARGKKDKNQKTKNTSKKFKGT